MKNLKCLLAFVIAVISFFGLEIEANATCLSLVDLGDTTPEIVVLEFPERTIKSGILVFTK